jgi:hypothetical protein
VSTERDDLDLLREVLDKELVDSQGRSCGVADDLEFAAGPDGPRVTAILVGPGAWSTRLPALLQVAATAVFGHGRVRVPWREIARIDVVIELRSTAEELGLGRLDRKAGRWLRKIPLS